MLAYLPEVYSVTEEYFTQPEVANVNDIRFDIKASQDLWYKSGRYGSELFEVEAPIWLTVALLLATNAMNQISRDEITSMGASTSLLSQISQEKWKEVTDFSTGCDQACLTTLNSQSPDIWCNTVSKNPVTLAWNWHCIHPRLSCLIQAKPCTLTVEHLPFYSTKIEHICVSSGCQYLGVYCAAARRLGPSQCCEFAAEAVERRVTLSQTPSDTNLRWREGSVLPQSLFEAWDFIGGEMGSRQVMLGFYWYLTLQYGWCVSRLGCVRDEEGRYISRIFSSEKLNASRLVTAAARKRLTVTVRRAVCRREFSYKVTLLHSFQTSLEFDYYCTMCFLRHEDTYLLPFTVLG